MNHTDASVGNKPMSAKQLTDRAREFEWNPRIGFKYWARAAETIHHEVRHSPRSAARCVYANIPPCRAKSICKKETFPKRTLFCFDTPPWSSIVSSNIPKPKNPKRRKP